MTHAALQQSASVAQEAPAPRHFGQRLDRGGAPYAAWDHGQVELGTLHGFIGGTGIGCVGHMAGGGGSNEGGG